MRFLSYDPWPKTSTRISAAGKCGSSFQLPLHPGLEDGHAATRRRCVRGKGRPPDEEMRAKHICHVGSACVRHAGAYGLTGDTFISTGMKTSLWGREVKCVLFTVVQQHANCSSDETRFWNSHWFRIRIFNFDLVVVGTRIISPKFKSTDKTGVPYVYWKKNVIMVICKCKCVCL